MITKFFIRFFINLIHLKLISFNKKKTKNNLYYIFVNNYNSALDSLEALMIKNNLKYIIITKDKTLKKKNIFTTNQFGFNYIFLNRKKKFFICNESHECLPYIFFDNQVIFNIYDTARGRDISFLYKYFERIVINKIKFLMMRDLRFKKNYEKYFNNNKIINFLNFDISKLKNCKKKKKNKNFIIIGYFDLKTVSFFKLCLKIIKQKYKIYVAIQPQYKNNFHLLKKKLENENICSKNLLLIDFKDIVRVSDQITYGICPHDDLSTYNSRIYYKYCSSSRILDYIQLNLITILDVSCEFQIYVLNKYKKKYIDYKKFLNCDINEDFINLVKYKKNNLNNQVIKKNFSEFIQQYNNFKNAI